MKDYPDFKHQVFEFKTTSQLLSYLRTSYPGRRSKLSLNEFAKKLGYRSSRTVGMVLSGKRPPTVQMIDALAQDLKLEGIQKQYIGLLAKRDRALLKKNEKQREIAENEMKALAPRISSYLKLSLEALQIVSSWYHWPIRQLVRTKNFDRNPKVISEKLRKKVTPTQVEQAIDSLLKLGLLTEKNGQLEFIEDRGVFTGHNIPSKAIRELHRQMMDRALESIEEQGVLDRHLTSFTLAVNKNKVREIKEKIQNFVDEINAQYSAKDTDSVYQFNVQFFEHTLN